MTLMVELGFQGVLWVVNSMDLLGFERLFSMTLANEGFCFPDNGE